MTGGAGGMAGSFRLGPLRPVPGWLRWAGRSAIVLGVLVAALALLAFAMLRQTVPARSGAVVLAGLKSPVEIVYDREAVPHISAREPDDAYVALGFVHAQHRLWQMELMRRAGQGRLSELFGRATLGADMFTQTIDLYGHAERSLKALSPPARNALEAYARGVNGYLARPRRLLEPRLPPEFLMLWVAPEPWRPADSLVIVKLMALQLGRNLDKEVDRLLLAAHGLAPDEIEHLMPTVEPWGAPPLPDLRALYPLEAPDGGKLRHCADAEGRLTSGGASNNWVVAGRRTASGAPLLANDPHLGLSAPSVWYLVHLAVGNRETPANLVGASLPGTPLVPLGRGDTLAWGLTNTESDVQDLYIERIDPADPARYLTPDGSRPFVRENVTIHVRGGAPVTFERLTTRHGPVISPVYRGLDRVLGSKHVAALRSTALTSDDTSIEVGLFDARLRTVGDIIAATRAVVGPMQSMVIADSRGSIGLMAAGRLPIRNPENRIQGRAPVPGWDARYDWVGTVPFADLPRRIDPPAGAIATSNTQMVGADYPHLVTYDWPPGFRQQRIRELVLDRDGHDMGSMRRAQLDVHSPAFGRLKSLMVRQARDAGAAEPALLAGIEAWDGGMRADSAMPLVFVAWFRQSLLGIYGDDLGALIALGENERAEQLMALLEGRPAGRDWCDDRRTPARETCGQILAAALARAIADLEARFGRDRKLWRWGDAHVALGEHRPLGLLPVAGRFFNIETPSSGGPFTINRGKTSLFCSDPFANREATTFRAIYDLADLDRSLFIQSTGQSGNPFSADYRTFVDRWRDGGYITIPAARAAYESHATGRWHVSPPAR